MKKALKNLLIGAGIAAAGCAVYFALKKTEPVSEEPDSTENAKSIVSTGFSKEYIEHRKQKIKAAAARRTEQKNTDDQTKMREDGAASAEESGAAEEITVPASPCEAEVSADAQDETADGQESESSCEHGDEAAGESPDVTEITQEQDEEKTF